MEIMLLTVGKTANRDIEKLIDAYLSRLKHYIPFKIVELPDARKVAEAERRKEEEGKAILSRINAGDHVCLLDERGEQLSSMQFSSLLQKRMASGLRRVVFVVGGPYGFSQEVYSRADSKLSLSRMTFNHEMVRLFFIEQIYRAMTILRGEPYHHE